MTLPSPASSGPSKGLEKILRVSPRLVRTDGQTLSPSLPRRLNNMAIWLVDLEAGPHTYCVRFVTFLGDMFKPTGAVSEPMAFNAYLIIGS